MGQLRVPLREIFPFLYGADSACSRQYLAKPAGKYSKSPKMSAVSSTPSRTQSPSGNQAFPGIYVRERTPPPTVVNRAELPDGKEDYEMAIMPSPVREISPESINKGRVNYKPIPEKRMLGYMSTAALIINKMIGTGIFSMPSSVLTSTGSKGASLFLWVTGGFMTLSGLIVYLEFGLALPFNGGELVYLDESYTTPRYLASCVFAILFVLLGNTAANSIAFAKHMLGAFSDNPNPDYRLQQFVALVCITFICLIHFFSRRMGIYVNNTLALYKVALLVFVVVTGFVCLGGGGGKHLKEGDPYGIKNLEHSFRGSEKSPHDYASAMLHVLYSYQGWENANYVLAEVRRPQGDPSKTFKRAALFAFSLVTILYILANVAYFSVSTTDELITEGVLVAADFFIRVFGNGAFVNKGLKVLIAMSAFGNVVAVTYTNSKVKQEIAKLRILPFSRYWARESPYNTPVGALTLHWIFTAIVIVATPNYSENDEAYSLVSILFTYAHTWVGIFVAIGLVTLRYHRNFLEWRPVVVGWKTLYALVAFYITSNVFIIVLIWWPSVSVIPSYIGPTVSTGVLGFGVIYWFGFAKVLPALGYEIDSEPDELVDGSRVVTYKRFKTGFAKRVSSWWDVKFKKGNH